MKTDALANGALAAPCTQGWPWIVVGAVAAAAGVVARLQMTARMQQDVVAAMEARKPFDRPAGASCGLSSTKFLAGSGPFSLPPVEPSVAA